MTNEMQFYCVIPQQQQLDHDLDRMPTAVQSLLPSLPRPQSLRHRQQPRVLPVEPAGKESANMQVSGHKHNTWQDC
jgi:hypothetical protein